MSDDPHEYMNFELENNRVGDEHRMPSDAPEVLVTLANHDRIMSVEEVFGEAYMAKHKGLKGAKYKIRGDRDTIKNFCVQHRDRLKILKEEDIGVFLLVKM